MPGLVARRKQKQGPNDAVTARVAPGQAGQTAAGSTEEPFRDGKSSVRQNQPINQDHIHKLKETFKKSGLERRTPEHRIIALCSADKATVNKGTVEVIAGQHRIKALCAYL
ncbi:hypothetical protein LZ31DRAFT_601652 [Colletotrichum somersetense]|nr:hypothetical protein LZ31DRAFT_601652 [Colletotrichum somersetense]